MGINKLLYLIFWYVKIKFFNKKIPLQTVIFISNICNYNCKHCCVDKTTPKKMTFGEVKEHLIYSYKLGSRFVDFEGGEPIQWRDGDKNINDLCNLAKEIGFFSTTVTTNASKDFSFVNADHIFISLDGLKSHNIIRGEGAFEKLSENIKKFPCPNKVSANMVINSINKDEVQNVLAFIEQSPYINGISFNFYNPVNNDNTLCVSNKEEIINTIIKYKNQGYKILNTKTGLNYLKNPTFPKVCFITNFITVDNKRFSGCPDTPNSDCKNCGLGMAGEMKALYNFSFETILAGIKLRLTK